MGMGHAPVIILREGTKREKGKDAQMNNISAAVAISGAVKSSLGPRGMDKMLVDSMGDVIITNDGVTILKEMDVQHPKIGSMPIAAARPNPLARFHNRVIKRVFDIVFSSIFLVFFPIILIPVAIAIKLSSPGPVFFKQKRTGFLGEEFNCWKFRTMRVNADADTRQATADDPRKTRVGNFLRKTSIDELPQFINVWLGNMSVVGPRPHMLAHTEQYARLIDQYMVRHFIKPGITGWAQVNGFRGQTEELWQMEKRVEYDVWYIENWNLLLDIKIVFKTIFNAVRGEENAF